MDNLLIRLRMSVDNWVRASKNTLSMLRHQDDISALWMDAETFYKASKYDEAIDILSKILKLEPGSTNALLQRAICYGMLERYDEALNDINKLIRQSRYRARYIEWRANILLQLKLYHSAISDFTYLIDVGYQKKTLMNYRYRAACAYNVDSSLAIHDYSYVIEKERDPKLLKEDYVDRGFTYFLLGEMELALTDFKSAIGIDPQYLKAYQGCLDVYMLQKQFDEALDLAKEYLKAKPESIDILKKRAQLYILLSQNENAVGDYQRLLELDPQQVTCHNELALAYSHRGDLDKALEHAIIVIEQSTPRSEYFDTRAQAYWLTADYDKALADFETAIRLNKKGLYLAGKAVTTLKMGETAKAIALWQEAIHLDESLADPAVFDQEHHYAPQYVQAIRELAEKAKLPSD